MNDKSMRRVAPVDIASSSSKAQNTSVPLTRRSKRKRKHRNEREQRLSKSARLVHTEDTKKPEDSLFEHVKQSLHVLGDGGVLLRQSNIPNAGLGLFANRSFKPCEPITAYTGESVTHQEAIKRRKQGAASHLRRHIALRFAIDGSRAPDGMPIVDASQQMQGRGVGAFANHGGARRANADFAFVDSPHNERQMQQFLAGASNVDFDPDERITYLRATKPIAKGEEILLDYGSDYWQHASIESK